MLRKLLLIDFTVWLMRQFRYSGKFMITGMVVVMPLSYLFVNFLSEIGGSIEFGRKELSGSSYNRALDHYMRAVASGAPAEVTAAGWAKLE